MASIDTPSDAHGRRDRRYRAVVVGCGAIGSAFSESPGVRGARSHAAAYRGHARTELAGFADVDGQRLRSAQRAWGVEGDTDAIALCRRTAPDIVSICTPDATHAPVAEQLLAEAPPRLLFIEKPLALRVADAEHVLMVAEKAGVAVAVNYSRRFAPAVQTLGDELRRGVHGRPVLARIVYGKGLVHNGSHAIDLMRFWLGEPVEAHGHPAAWGPDGDPTFDVEVRFAGGCRLLMEAFDERVATVFDLDFLTERSRWSFRRGGEEWAFYEVADSPVYAGYRNYMASPRAETDPAFHEPLAACLPRAIDNLVAFLDGAGTLVCPGSDALTTLRWVGQIRGER